MALMDLLKEKLEKRVAALDEELQAAEAEAKARKARAEAEVADAELEQELLTRVNDLKERLAEGQVYLKELSDVGEEKAEEIKLPPKFK